MNDLIKYFPFLAIAAPIALFWNQAKNFFLRIISFFWKKRAMNEYEAAEFYKYFKRKCKSVSFDNYQFNVINAFDLKENDFKLVAERKNYNEIFFYNYIFPVSFSESGATVNISYFKFTVPFEKVVKEILDNRNKLRNSEDDNFGEATSHYISTIKGKKKKGRDYSDGGSPDDFFAEPKGRRSGGGGESQRGVPLFSYIDGINQKTSQILNDDVENYLSWKPQSFGDKYVFTKIGSEVNKQVEKWSKAEIWYNKKSIRYYRGILLHSKPGLGKSSLVLEIAKRNKLPLFVFDISSFSNNDLDNEIENIQNLKGIILFEDIDCVWKGRENLNKTDLEIGVTFDYFLNKLSGVNAIKNKFVFITTNFVESLDSALIRPGRIDEIIEIQPLNKEEKFAMAKAIIGVENNFEKIVEEGENDTTAEFENRCVQASLKLFWN